MRFKWGKWLFGAILILSILALLIYGQFFWPPDPGSSLQTGESAQPGGMGEETTGETSDGTSTGVSDQERVAQSELPIHVSVEEVHGFEYLAEESEGLELTFTDVDVTLSDGEALTISRPHMTVPAGSDTYIYLDLYDLSLHALPAAVHRGGVHLATVTSGSEDVEDVVVEEEFVIPDSRVGEVLQKLDAAESVSVAVLGEATLDEHDGDEALMDVEEGDGGSWMDYVFDPSFSAAGLTLPHVEQVRVDHYPTYPASPRFGMVHLGLPYTEDEPSDDEEEPSNPLVGGGYDLAILDLGPQFDDHDMEHMENTVRTLRQAGTEVLLLTPDLEMPDSSEMQAHDEDSLIDQQQWLVELAEAWGAEVADAGGYIRAAAGEGLHVIHPSTAGEDGLPVTDPSAIDEKEEAIRALAVRSVLTDRLDEEEADDFELPEDTFVVAGEYGQAEDGSPIRAEIQFTPDLSAGVTQSSHVTDELANPALRFGGKSAEEAVTVLSTGEIARFSHPNGTAVDFLIEPSSSFEADVTVGDTDLVIDYLSGGEEEWAQLELVEGIGLSRYADFPNLFQTGIDVRVTSGELRLIGAVFYVGE